MGQRQVGIHVDDGTLAGYVGISPALGEKHLPTGTIFVSDGLVSDQCSGRILTAQVSDPTP